MLFPKLHICILLMVMSRLVFGQELYQPKPDSVVKMISEDYDGDTITKHSIEIKKFHKGNLVSSVAILKSKKAKANWIDSVVAESYFRKGKPIKTLIRNYNYYECTKYPSYPPGFQIWPEPNSGNAQSQPTLYPCPTVYLTEKLHLDSMTVMHVKNLSNPSEPQTHDTLIYCFINRFFKYHSEYRDTICISARQRDYIFDKGRLTAFVNTFYNGSRATKQEEKIKVYSKDTLTLSQSSIEKRDSLTVHFEFKRIYDKNYRQVGYLSFENEVEKYRGLTSYYENGLVKENYAWRDSLPEQTEKYWWKRSKGKLECWRSQDYKHSSDYNGNYYTLIDTSFANGKMIVAQFGSKIKAEPSLMPAQHVTEKDLYQQREYDDKGRLILIRNIDYDTGDLSSVTSWEYWRE